MPLLFQITYIINVDLLSFFLCYKAIYNSKITLKMVASITVINVGVMLLDRLFTYKFEAFWFWGLFLLIIYLFFRQFLLSVVAFIIIYTLNFIGQSLFFEFIPFFMKIKIDNSSFSILCFSYFILTFLFSITIFLLQKKYNLFQLLKSLTKNYYTTSFFILLGILLFSIFHYMYTLDTIAEDLFSSFFILLYSGAVISLVCLFSKIEKKQTEVLQLVEHVEIVKQQEEKINDFKHDYNSLLLSLALYIKNDEKEQAIDLIKQESEYFTTTVFESEELALLNISIIPMQSLLQIFSEKCKNSNISLNMYIPNKVTDITINMIDFIRCISIMLNNALEASKEVTHPLIYIELEESEQQTSICIKNKLDSDQNIDTKKIIQKKYTTKKGHKGRGLSILFNLINKYENADVTLLVRDSFFSICLTIEHSYASNS